MTSQIISFLEAASKLPRWLFFVEGHHHHTRGHLATSLDPSVSVFGHSNYSTGNPRLKDDLDIEPTVSTAVQDPDDKKSSGVLDQSPRWNGTPHDRHSYNPYTTRMLIWTLIVEVWILWTPEAVHSVFLHLAFLAFVGVLMILKLHRFGLSTRCVKSCVIYIVTVLCAGCGLTLVAHPVFLRYEYLVKKVILKEYQHHLGRNPHVYVVTSGLVIMTCVARGLHKQPYYYYYHQL